jgi:hypothetical protein
MTVGEPSDDAEGSYCFEYRVKIPLWGPTAERRNASKPPVFGELSMGCRNHLAWTPSNVARSLFELHGFPQRLSNLIRRTAPLPDGALSPLHPVSICELETSLRHVEPAGPHIGQIGLPGHDGASCVQPVVLVGMHRFGLVVDAHGLSTGGGRPTRILRECFRSAHTSGIQKCAGPRPAPRAQCERSALRCRTLNNPDIRWLGR